MIYSEMSDESLIEANESLWNDIYYAQLDSDNPYISEQERQSVYEELIILYRKAHSIHVEILRRGIEA